MKQEFNDMVNEKFDFDIAMVICGVFGMLLSEYIFHLNKSVICVGGVGCICSLVLMAIVGRPILVF